MSAAAVLWWLAVACAPAFAPEVDTARVYRLVPGLSRASYAVQEVFLLENNRLFTAVGVTPAVTGTIVADPARPQDARIDEIAVDLRQLESDSERRDRALREKYLATHTYPFARLTRGVFQGLPAKVVAGKPFTYTIAGELTVHGTTRRTSWQGEATLAGDTLRGVARTQVKMSAFGIEVPSLLSLRSADDVKLEIRFVAVVEPPSTSATKQP